ncbi:MAG: GNAT family N-acetyltransferase [Alphaproteobacteria bacterium]|nr:GNAT family N-acetyltransferase [Alphaproteobacteria bacterium]
MTAFLRTPPWLGPTPVLHGRRLVLRAPAPADWSQWAELRASSREFLTPWEPAWTADELSREAYRRRLRRYARDAREAVGYAFFLFAEPGEQLLGGATLSNLRRGVTQSGQLGYWMGQTYAGQGYMTEAVALLLPFAFEELQLHRMEAACLPSNERSRRLLLRVGFREEGFARQYLRIDGAWRDHVLFAMLASDPRPPSPARPGG